MVVVRREERERRRKERRASIRSSDRSRTSEAASGKKERYGPNFCFRDILGGEEYSRRKVLLDVECSTNTNQTRSASEFLLPTIVLPSLLKPLLQRPASSRFLGKDGKHDRRLPFGPQAQDDAAGFRVSPLEGGRKGRLTGRNVQLHLRPFLFSFSLDLAFPLLLFWLNPKVTFNADSPTALLS